jgi:hypothetical protein
MEKRMQTMTMTEEETEPLDLSKLKWRRPLHTHETLTQITMTPWKALCGAILYDIIPQGERAGHPICAECRRIYDEIANGNS